MTSKPGMTQSQANPLRRRFPRLKELMPNFDLSLRRAGDQHLERCSDIPDIRRLARRRVPQMVFDFVDGAAGTESSIERARELFSRTEFKPRAMRDVSSIVLSHDILGYQSDLPFFLAPTGGTRLMHAGGEAMVARAAGKRNILYTLSTLGTTSVEDLAANAPDSKLWFQLYLIADRVAAMDTINRAWESGFDTLMVAVDCPVPGRRNRDVRNGLVVPPKLTWRSIAKVIGYPRWWFDKLTTPPVEFAMISAQSESPAERMSRTFDPTITVEDVRWLHDIWPGKLVVKGLLNPEDARKAADAGADAVYLSSHGGRQLDKAPLPLELIADTRTAVGNSVQIIVDGGVMNGGDIVACYAAGADAVGVGRAYLYGLMAAGETGVSKVIDLLAAEIKTTLALMGHTSISDLSSTDIRFR